MESEVKLRVIVAPLLTVAPGDKGGSRGKLKTIALPPNTTLVKEPENVFDGNDD